MVTLKERRVSLVGTTNNRREGKKVDRKLEVKRLSEMGKGIRRKSAPPAAVSAAVATGDNEQSDKKREVGGDLILTQQSKDTTPNNNTIATSNNNTNTPNNNIEIKKVGGRPAKSRSSITNGNISNNLYQGAIINPLKCPHCSKDFLSEKGLQYHVGKFCFYILFVLFGSLRGDKSLEGVRLNELHLEGAGVKDRV